MKLIVLCSRFPYPLEKGDKLRIFHQIKGLSEYFDITLIALCEDHVDADSRLLVEKYCSDLHIFRITKARRAISLLSSILGSKPLSISYYYNKKVHQRITEIIKNVQPDHIFCQLTRMSEYVKNNTSTLKTLDYMDAFGVGMKKRAEVSHVLFARLYRLEGKRMEAYESDIFEKFDFQTIISSQDRDLFEFEGSKKIEIIPNGVDNEYFRPDLSKVKTHAIGFIGNMGYLPNIQSAEYLVNVLMPKLPENVDILLSGARPHHRVQQLTQKRVTISGWMEDIREAYASCEIFVAPLWSGTGQQNKILEAMAMGVPCITTPIVNSAIGAEDGKEILIADTRDEFIDKINTLLKNDELRKYISKNSLGFVKGKYSWSSSNYKLGAILRNKK